MRSGIGYPSFARTLVWQESGGAGTLADFPVTNLSSLDEPRRVTRASAAGDTAFLAAFGGAQTVDFIAIIHHNLPAAATVRIVLYGTPAISGDYVYDVTAPVWPVGIPTAEYPAVRPVILPAPVVAYGIYIQFANMGDAVAEVGGIEIGRLWEWNVEVPRGIGVDSRSSVTESAGVQHVTKQWAPRTVTGERELIAQSEVDTKFMDFQMDTGLSKAFVWCWDVDDPATWARQAVLVTNSSLPPGTVPDWNVGRMGFAFREHLR